MVTELVSSWSIYIVAVLVGLIIIYWFLFKKKGDGNTSSSHTTKQQTAEEQDDKDDGRPKMLILYGSQTGTAEEFSNTLAHEAKRFGFRPQVIDLVDFDSPEERLAQEKLVVFVVATYGEGEPTDNARDFYEWLKDESLPSDLLANTHFTVFGLGNKQYKIYQAMARIFDKRLEELGGKRVFEKGEGDADDNIEEHFEDWKSRMLPELSAFFETNAEQGEDVIEMKYEIKYYPDTIENAQLPFDHPRSIPDAKTPFLSTILVNRQLLKEGKERSTVHVEFDIKGSRISYEAGDHLAVYAENTDEVVDAYAKRLGIADQMNKVFSMIPKKDKSKPALYPKKTTFRSALKHYCDLNGMPRKKFLKGLALHAKDEQEKKELLELAANTNEGKAKFKSFIKDAGTTALEVLEHFKSVELPIDFFFETVPRLQARYYSIASSSGLHPTSIHAVVAVVKYTTPTGKSKQGLCSSYLERLPAGSKAYAYVRQSNFHLPRDMQKPVIMVGPGTGLAPMVGFLQQRRAQKNKGTKLGDAYLFFGCRNKTEDFIYQEDQESAERDGVISKLVVAFSRDQKEKVYVQHKMLEYGEAIWKALEAGGVFYVCGDAKYMAKDVDKALQQIVEKYGNKTPEEAQKFLDKISLASRYLRDVWSPS